MDTPAPNRVFVVFALSEAGRQDAFRSGHAIEATHDRGLSVVEREISFETDPDLFRRAASLPLLLSRGGESADVPIGSYLIDGNEFWRLRSDGSCPCDKDFQEEFGGVVNYAVPTPPGARRPLPAILNQTGFDSLDEMRGEIPEHFSDQFAGFDHFPSTEELIEFEEEAHAVAASSQAFAAEEPSLRAKFEQWLERTRERTSDLLDRWLIENDVDEALADDVKAYRSALEELSGSCSRADLEDVLLEQRWSLINRHRANLTAAEERANTADAVAWIKQHGSERLRRIADENLLATSMAVYRDERLAHDRPGWAWMPSKVILRDPVAPGEEEFVLLDAARESAPDALLRYATVGKGSGRFVAVATLVGRDIWYPGDALADIEGAAR